MMIFIFDVCQLGFGRVAQSKALPWSLEMLISKDDFKDYIARIYDLETKVHL